MFAKGYQQGLYGSNLQRLDTMADYNSRQNISSSLIDTRNSYAAHQFLRKSTNREEGWLEIDFSDKSYNISHGRRCWVVFECMDADGGMLHIHLDPNSEAILSVPISSVLSCKADNATRCIKLQTTGDQKLNLRASDSEEMKRWLFTLQKSVALLISLLTSENGGNDNWKLKNRSDSAGLRGHPSTIFTNIPSPLDGNRIRNQPSYERRNTFDTRNDRSNAFNSPSLDANFTRQISIDPEASMIRSQQRYAQASASYHTSGNYMNSMGNTSVLSSNSSFYQSPSPLSRSPGIPIINSIQRSGNSMKLAGSYTGRENERSLDVVMSSQNQFGNMLLQTDTGVSIPTALDTEPIVRNERDGMFEMDDIDNIQSANIFSKQEIPKPAPGVSLLSSHILAATRNETAVLTWESGSCSLLGKRNSNEDRFVTEDNIVSSSSSSKVKQAFYAVYDGHTGVDAAAYLQENLHLEISRHPQFNVDAVKAIEETCCDVDKTFLGICRERRKESGSTALGMFLRGSELILFNIGDSCAVLSTNGFAEEIMKAHKPNRPDEYERIMKAKGWITEEKELFLGRLRMMNMEDPFVRKKAEKLDWVMIHRICGEISVSRSIGDPIYKNFIPGQVVQEYFCWPEGHDMIFEADLVIPLPECKIIQITPQQEFVILASDGLWDVLSLQDAVDIAKEAFRKGKDCPETAEELCKLAIDLGSSDNVTVVIVKFKHT